MCYEQIHVEVMYLICFVENNENLILQKLEDLLKANEEEKKVRGCSAFHQNGYFSLF